MVEFFFRQVLAWTLLLVAWTRPQSAAYAPPPRPTMTRGQSFLSSSSIVVSAAPKGALPDLVIPNSIPLLNTIDDNDDEDPRVWVPQTDCLWFRPLCFCVSQGYYVNILKFKGGGVLGCHYHASPVHAVTLKGSWGYKEHDWHAKPGTYVFEPPGETHTLIVDDHVDEMMALFHVTGALMYMDPNDTSDKPTILGYDDVFTKLEKARAWYKECGLGEEYAEQFVR